MSVKHGVFTDEAGILDSLSGERACFTDKVRWEKGLSVKHGVFTDEAGILDSLSGKRAVFTDKVG